MADVFISYSRRNQASALAAAKALREAGFDVWFDHELPAHGSFTDAIEQQLAEAKAVLAIWSREAVASEWVRAEANRESYDSSGSQHRLHVYTDGVERGHSREEQDEEHSHGAWIHSEYLHVNSSNL